MRLIFPGAEPEFVMLNPGVNRLGSASDCTVVLRAPGMPAVAADIHVVGPRVHIAVQAGAEIFVNGHRVFDLLALRNGDQLQIAGVQAHFVTFAAVPSIIESDRSALTGKPPVLATTGADLRFVLYGLSGAHFERLYPLTGTIVVGRDPECKILLSAPDVSRRHASIQTTPTDVLVDDLASTNGIYINGTRVRSGILLVGDELRLSTHSFLMCELHWR